MEGFALSGRRLQGHRLCARGVCRGIAFGQVSPPARQFPCRTPVACPSWRSRVRGRPAAHAPTPARSANPRLPPAGSADQGTRLQPSNPPLFLGHSCGYGHRWTPASIRHQFDQNRPFWRPRVDQNGPSRRSNLDRNQASRRPKNRQNRRKSAVLGLKLADSACEGWRVASHCLSPSVPQCLWLACPRGACTKRPDYLTSSQSFNNHPSFGPPCGRCPIRNEKETHSGRTAQCSVAPQNFDGHAECNRGFSRSGVQRLAGKLAATVTVYSVLHASLLAHLPPPPLWRTPCPPPPRQGDARGSADARSSAGAGLS